MAYPGFSSRKLFWLILTLFLVDLFPASAMQAPQLPQPRSPSPGATARKPAWTWSVEERLSRRFNPEAMAARERERIAQEKALRNLYPPSADLLTAEEQEAGPATDTIDGKRTPELFLTWELFGSLLNRGFPPDGQFRSELRGPIEERAAALGFGHDMWPRLEKAAAPLLEMQRERERLGPSRSGTLGGSLKMDAEAISFCRTRARAIAAAKAEFGEEPFLRLLYEAVAPNVEVILFLQPGLAKHLRFVEGGCQ